MNWQRVRFIVDAPMADSLGDALLEAGAISVDAADADLGTPDEHPIFGEPGSLPESWPRTELSVLFTAGYDVASAMAGACEELGAPLPDYLLDTVADQDWVRLTQSQFGPIPITDRFWIVPTWSDPPRAEAKVLRLDPGLAFGTGSHPTTRLCLRWIADNLGPGWRVLDYGCGSGVLAIAAGLHGAGRIVGVDVDPNAVSAARDNALANGVEATFGLPDTDMAPQTFDLVVANILANPLRVLAPLLCGRCAPGGTVVLSGILESQADEMAGIYAHWLDMGPPIPEDGWVCLVGRKRMQSQD